MYTTSSKPEPYKITAEDATIAFNALAVSTRVLRRHGFYEEYITEYITEFHRINSIPPKDGGPSVAKLTEEIRNAKGTRII